MVVFAAYRFQKFCVKQSCAHPAFVNSHNHAVWTDPFQVNDYPLIRLKPNGSDSILVLKLKIKRTKFEIFFKVIVKNEIDKSEDDNYRDNVLQHFKDGGEPIIHSNKIADLNEHKRNLLRQSSKEN